MNVHENLAAANLESLDVPAILRRWGLTPDKRLGQNFLVQPGGLKKVVEAADPSGQDVVLEVGPGLGSLTRLLAQAACRVVAVEIDGRLMGPLEEVLAGCDNVELVQGDILELDLADLLSGALRACGRARYLVAANIPYYITSNLIRRLLEAPITPARIVLTLQLEVAQRICAGPGEMSLLGLSVQVYGSPRICAHLPPAAFYPSPEVDSAVVRVDLYDRPLIEDGLRPLFFRLAKAGFAHRRKMLRNALASGMRWKAAQAALKLQQAGIDPQRRAETLSIPEWRRLTEVCSEDYRG